MTSTFQPTSPPKLVPLKNFPVVCRTCCGEINLNPIFGTYVGQIEATSLLSESVVLQVDRNDTLPQNICTACIDEIWKIYLFKKQVHDNDSMFRSILNQSQDVKDVSLLSTVTPPAAATNKTTTEIDNQNDVQKIEIKEEPKVENIVVTPDTNEAAARPGTSREDSVNDDDDDFNWGDDNDNDNDNDDYNPANEEDNDSDDEPLAVKAAKPKTQRGRPKKKQPKEEEEEEEEEEDDSDYEPLSKKQKVASPKKKEKGAAAEGGVKTEKILKCKKCDITFATKEEMDQHRKETKHTEEISGTSSKSQFKNEKNNTPHNCEICLKTYTTRIALVRHKKTHDPSQRHQCLLCEKSYTRISILRVHERSCHTGERPFICNTCGKSYNSKGYLNCHKKFLHSPDVQKYICNICSKICKHKDALRSHLRRHNPKKILCSYCGKYCITKAVLEQHIRIHTGEKPYACSICKKSFAHKGSLLDHKKTHTGEKPHKCHICNKNFSSGKQLERHLLTHSGERAFKCQFCNKAFSRRDNLRVHVKIHTGEPHLCTICGKGFSNILVLSHHRRSHKKQQVDKHINAALKVHD